MKLTEDQQTVLKALLALTDFSRIVLCWEFAHDRNLVVDELLELCKKLKITVRRDQVKHMRELADKGKK